MRRSVGAQGFAAVLVLCAALLGAGCEPASEEPEETRDASELASEGEAQLSASTPAQTPEPIPPIVLPGDDEVLARVNGTAVTAYEVDVLARRLVGPNHRDFVDGPTRRKLLETLVMRRAMSQAVESELRPMERAELDKEVEAAREELLVNRYLAARSRPSPVTEAAIGSYYEAYPERFGGRTTRRIEMLLTTEKVSGTRRADLIRALGDGGVPEQWKALAAELSSRGFPVRYRLDELDAQVLDERLRSTVEGLAVGEVSDLTVAQGRLYRIRILSETVHPPRPLAEVRPEIRRLLGQRRLRDAIEAASEELMKSVDVQYGERATAE